MPSLSGQHKEMIRAAWKRAPGNPRILAQTAFKTLFDFGDEIGLDYDDQVSHAIYIGILAADAMLGKGGKDVEVFISEFEKEVLNDEQVY